MTKGKANKAVKPRSILPALNPRQQINLRALRQFLLPVIPENLPVDRDGDTARDVGRHAGIGLFQLAEEFADGLGIDLNDGRSARCRTERPPKVDISQI